ncbi:hypothetical protein B0A49_09292 [Cryomyces minteri]|uniref:Maintenance of telomere capping protein 1 n=1 Tax=Cryomyces minteri TaxID=331657 RepID=A0A4U0WIH8_9PEZI|nr:hypothetical protein B0A49_09292 [Cryomyces minteri]
MASKKALTDEELFAQFEGIGDDDSTTSTTTTNKAPARAVQSNNAPSLQEEDEDPLAELTALASARPVSRPSTPADRLSSSTTSGKRTDAVHTPSSSGPGSGRTSEDKPRVSAPRRSGESTRSFHQSSKPTVDDVADQDLPQQKVFQAPPPPPTAKEEEKKQGGGGGWWGSVFATASAAVKQAEAAVKEIQKNEEAQRWAEQVKGNRLHETGGQLSSRALPTFTNILHTLAPPISQHERLQIHITHDLIGYPSLDSLIYTTFSRVMSQVEGGDLLVIQRGSESSHRRASTDGYTGGSQAGWSDGPWWRDSSTKRDLGLVQGLREGTRLVRVAAESYATDFFATRGGVEEAAKAAASVLSESNPVRSSDIFLAIQAVGYTAPSDLFAGPSEATPESGHAEKKLIGGIEDAPDAPDALVAFALFLHDPIHSITFATLSQPTPQKWTSWLDAAPTYPDSDYGDAAGALPAEIMDIINAGGVDPREWVAEWVEEVLGLSVGVVAQRYVARRMGVGEGGIGRGKKREEVVEAGGGEAARAI